MAEFFHGQGTRSGTGSEGPGGSRGPGVFAGSGTARGQIGSGRGYTPGDIVRHPQFGDGEVLAFWPGASARVQVKFRAAGIKTLVLEYARLTKVS